MGMARMAISTRVFTCSHYGLAIRGTLQETVAKISPLFASLDYYIGAKAWRVHMRLLVAVMFSLAAVASASAADRVLPQSPAQIQLSFAPVVSKVTPAVVNVYARRVIRQPINPLFQQFFGEGAMRSRVEQSLGSGVTVRPDGIILT